MFERPGKQDSESVTGYIDFGEVPDLAGLNDEQAEHVRQIAQDFSQLSVIEFEIKYGIPPPTSVERYVSSHGAFRAAVPWTEEEVQQARDFGQIND